MGDWLIEVWGDGGTHPVCTRADSEIGSAVDDGVKFVAAALTGLALLRSLGGGQAQVSHSLGPLRPIEPSEELDFELLWAEPEGKSVLEGPRRIRLVPMLVGDVLRALSTDWVRFLVDESSTARGTGTAELWIRSRAILRKEPSNAWAFRDGAPVRTFTLRLASGRRIDGVLP